LYECYKLLPHENYVYFADYDNMPYGDKDATQLRESIRGKLSWLIKEYKPCVVVLACNTATSLVIGHMRELYPDIIFVGTEPALIPAIRQGGKTLLLATNNTIDNSRLYKLVSKYFNIHAYSPPEFASFVEQNINNTKEITDYLQTDFAQYIGQYDNVVLGCTHYVLCAKQIASVLQARVYDGNNGIARRLESLLDLFGLHSNDGGIRFVNKGQMYTKLTNIFVEMSRRL